MRSPLASFAFFFVCLATPDVFAQSGPLITEEATTAERGRLALETIGSFMMDEPNFETGHARDRIDGPTLRFVYSPADTVEIDVEWTALVVGVSDPDFGTVKDFGDVTLRSKVRLRNGDAGGGTLGARFAVTLPQTQFGKGLGPNTLRMSAEGLATQAAGPVTIHLNAGLTLQDDVFRPHKQRDFVDYGLAFEWSRGARAALVAEIAGRAGRGTPGSESRSEVRIGGRLSGARTAGHIALRRGLADAQGTWGIQIGATWTLLRPK